MLHQSQVVMRVTRNHLHSIIQSAPQHLDKKSLSQWSVPASLSDDRLYVETWPGSPTDKWGRWGV